MKFSLLFLSSVVYAASTFDVQVGYSGRMEFFPNQLTVAPGDTVRFRFMSGTHTVTMEQPGQQCQKANPALFDYRQAVGATSEFMFHDPGTFSYFCAIGNHCQQGMRGTIVVSAAGAAPAAGADPNAPAGAAPAAGATPAATPAAAPATNTSTAFPQSNGTTTNGTTTPATTPTTTVPPTTNGTNATNGTGSGAQGNYEPNGLHWLMTCGAVAMTMGWLNA